MVGDDPSRIQAFGLPTSKVPFRSSRRELVKTGLATFPGPLPTMALVLGARPNLVSKSASRGPKAEKKKKNHSFTAS